jgi:hypothetical protein
MPINYLTSNRKTHFSLQAEGSQVGVTVVVTSCGRFDLLERTLESLCEFNTYPVKEIIVIEDGRLDNLPAQLLRDNRARFLSTGSKIGQIRAIDRAYAEVRTEYIFHCEDDWEFFAPGFIEKSLAILVSDPTILQVWLRALDDTNRHPVLHPTFFVGDIPYRLLSCEYTTTEWGTWHGFTFNPGLRRTREYRLLPTFNRLDATGNSLSYEVERAASEFYWKRGFVSAILADQGGKGYCRHIGWGRRVLAD